MYFKQILFLFYLTSYALADKNPVSYINKCEWNDPVCIIASTNIAIPILVDGIPEAGVEKMDPMSLDKVDASSPDLKLIVKDTKVIGLKNCKAVKMERNLEKSKIYSSLLCTGEINGHYEMKGKVLFLPIEGNGKLETKLKNLVIDIEADLETYKKKGEKHWHIKQWKSKFDLKEKSELVFHNLFGGNKVLAQAAETLIDENGNQLILDIAPPIFNAIITECVKNIEKYFKFAPLKYLIIN